MPGKIGRRQIILKMSRTLMSAAHFLRDHLSMEPLPVILCSWKKKTPLSPNESYPERIYLIMSKAPEVTAEDFDSQVLESDVPVLVDFYASWCPPCRLIAPDVDAVAAQMEGKARVFKLDVDAHPDVESRYGVRTIPTLIFFKGGQVVDQIIGPVRRSVMAEKLEAQLS
jgi:thioredoxin 1